MKFDREELSATLAKVLPAVGKGGSIAALSHLWFKEQEVYAHDGGLGIRLKYKTDLNLGAPGAPLLKLLGTSALKETELDEDSDNLKIKMGKSVSKLAALEIDMQIWPYPLKLPKGVSSLKLDEDVIEGLRKTLFVKASPQTRVEHYGVMVRVVKKDLELYATDSASLVCITLEGAAKGAGFESVLLPRGFVEQLVKEASEGADLYVLKDCIIAETPAISFYSNVLDTANAQDLGALLGKSTGTLPESVPLPAGFAAALERAEILAGHVDPVVTLTFKGAILTVSATYPLGTLKEELTIIGKHPITSLKVNAPIVRRALAHAETLAANEKFFLLSGEPGFDYLVAAVSA